MRTALSSRQEDILACMRYWIREHGDAPTVREIGQHVGLASPSSVHYQLKRLEDRGLISRSDCRSRPYRLAA
ncbi:LexA family protein [Streptomyces flavidovirens]